MAFKIPITEKPKAFSAARNRTALFIFNEVQKSGRKVKKVINVSNKLYDTLKWIAQIVLPAIGTLYFALASIWGLPYGEQIVGTITAIDAFLGAILGVSTINYNKRKEEEDEL